MNFERSLRIKAEIQAKRLGELRRLLEDLFQLVVQQFALFSRDVKQTLTVRNVETRVGVVLELLQNRLVLRRRLLNTHSLPAKRIYRKRIEISRVDSAFTKCFDKSDAIVVTIVLNQIGIGSDNPAQVFTKRDVNRRNVVERANAHVENVARCLRSFAR